MGYIDLIPNVFRLTMPDLATTKNYHTQKFNVGNKCCIGVTIKASQALSVAVAYGIVGDTAAAAGVDVSGTLPYKTSATSFASSTGTEAGTYHELAIPPHARQAQLVISNASGSTVSGAVIDAALRVVAYPAASGGGSSAFGDITGWPGAATDFVRGDGSYSALGATDIPALQYFRASRITSDQAGSGSYAANTVAYNSVDTNEGSNWSNSSGVLTCNKTGTYLVTFQTYNSNATDVVRAVQVNNVQKYITWTATNNARRHLMSFIYRFTQNDTLKLVAQSSVAPTIAKDETFVEAWLLKEG